MNATVKINAVDLEAIQGTASNLSAKGLRASLNKGAGPEIMRQLLKMAPQDQVGVLLANGNLRALLDREDDLVALCRALPTAFRGRVIARLRSELAAEQFFEQTAASTWGSTSALLVPKKLSVVFRSNADTLLRRQGDTLQCRLQDPDKRTHIYISDKTRSSRAINALREQVSLAQEQMMQDGADLMQTKRQVDFLIVPSLPRGQTVLLTERDVAFFNPAKPMAPLSLRVDRSKGKYAELIYDDAVESLKSHELKSHKAPMLTVVPK